jgi:hypothetical protein
MKNFLIGAVAGLGLLFINSPLLAQYLPGHDYQRVQTSAYRQESPLTAIEGTLASNGVSLNSSLSADQWNYFASETFPGFTPPSPETLFPSLASTPSPYSPSTNASHDPVSFSTWWNAIRPYLSGSGYEG